MDGRLHVYDPKPSRGLTLFEYKLHLQHTRPATNVLLFIGGMFDNYLQPTYTSDLARTITASGRWSMMHVQLSSAGTQFGTGSLDKDIEQIGAAVKWIRDYVGRERQGSDHAVNVVLMGHSTGCQDAMHYLIAPGTRPAVQGVILQAPVSDREALLDTVRSKPHLKTVYDDLVRIAEAIPDSERNWTLLPLSSTKNFWGPVPMTASRFLSLASPRSPDTPGGPDELFSSDLSDRFLRDTFGKNLHTTREERGGQILILISGADEHMPASIDKEILLRRWTDAFDDGKKMDVHPASAVVKGAKHDVGTDEKVRKDFLDRVQRYLEDVVGTGDDGVEGLVEGIRGKI